MKGHIQERKRIYLEGPIEGVINHILEIAGDLIDPQIELEYGYDAYSNDQYLITGWRPMTELELTKAQRAAEASKKATKVARAKAKAQERANAIKLLKKYPDIINELGE